MEEGDREPAHDPATVSPLPGDAAKRLGEERVGPLTLTRYRKRDGRALMLYERVDEAADSR
jgi:hypothetical protein